MKNVLKPLAKIVLTIFRLGRWGKKALSTTSTNVEISPQNLLTFSFNNFATLV